MGENDTATGGGVLRFLTFRVGQHLYALPAADVAEVIRIPPVARVPQVHAALLGIANLRGSVIPLASVRGLLGIAEQDALPTSRAIVLDQGTPLALAVDSVSALVAIEGERMKTRQAELAAEPGELLQGAFQVGPSVAKILDLQGLLQAAFVQRAKSQRQIRRHAAAAEEESIEGGAELLVTFDVGSQEFALRLAVVQEIVTPPERIAAMPGAEVPVLGMMVFRGQLLPLLSLRGLLGFGGGAERDEREKVLVTRVGGATVGLVADRVRAILSAQHSQIDVVPSLLAARTGGEAKIKAIYRSEAGRRLVSILEPEQLFREDVMQRLGSARPSLSPQSPDAAEDIHSEMQFVVFRLGDDEFALPIDAVDEVARVPDQITRLPRTPKFLEGVVNFRGDVLPIVDQRRRFEMPPPETIENRRLVVVRSERHRAGLIVDSVSEVLASSSAAVEATPDLTEQITRLVRGVINLAHENRIVLVLDPAELLTGAERGLLDAFVSRAKLAPP